MSRERIIRVQILAEAIPISPDYTNKIKAYARQLKGLARVGNFFSTDPGLTDAMLKEAETIQEALELSEQLPTKLKKAKDN